MVLPQVGGGGRPRSRVSLGSVVESRGLHILGCGYWRPNAEPGATTSSQHPQPLLRFGRRGGLGRGCLLGTEGVRTPPPRLGQPPALLCLGLASRCLHTPPWSRSCRACLYLRVPDSLRRTLCPCPGLVRLSVSALGLSLPSSFAISVFPRVSCLSRVSACLGLCLSPSPRGSSCLPPSSLISISVSRDLVPVPLFFLPSSSPRVTLPPTHLCLRPGPGETWRKKISDLPPPPPLPQSGLAREARSPPNSAPFLSRAPPPYPPSWHLPIPPLSTELLCSPLPDFRHPEAFLQSNLCPLWWRPNWSCLVPFLFILTGLHPSRRLTSGPLLPSVHFVTHSFFGQLLSPFHCSRQSSKRSWVGPGQSFLQSCPQASPGVPAPDLSSRESGAQKLLCCPWGALERPLLNPEVPG